MKIPLENAIFWVSRNFFIEFDLTNGCKNEFNDINEKSSSSSRNRLFHKIAFKTVWPRNGHADSVGVNKVVSPDYHVFSTQFPFPAKRTIGVHLSERAPEI